MRADLLQRREVIVRLYAEGHLTGNIAKALNIGRGVVDRALRAAREAGDRRAAPRASNGADFARIGAACSRIRRGAGHGRVGLARLNDETDMQDFLSQ